MAGYSRRALIEGIEKCRKNINVFKEAIKKENQTIEEYKFYIRKIDEKAKQEEKKILIDADSS